ncbi:MAG: dihydroorotase [Bacteroidota bacterium]
MSFLLKSATLYDKGSRFHKKRLNVLIEKGKIAYVGKESPNAKQTIDVKGGILSVGWFDMNTLFGDPGLEHKEDLSSGINLAAASGFTGIGLLPNTAPPTQNKNALSYLKSKNSDSLTQIYPYAAVTVDTKGEDLTEMIDLHVAGAAAFTDGVVPLWHPDILLKTLQYLQKFEGLLITRPEDVHLSRFGVMHEGYESTILGMKGIPNLAEDVVVQRDIELLDYAGGKIHFSTISSTKSVELIRRAKKKGLQVSCDIASFQALFEDKHLDTFNTNLKVTPPFRSSKDNQSLIKGLLDGTITVITSSHRPQDEEGKKLEFDLAEFGIISLQTVAANLCELSKKVDWEILIEAITSTPRSLLNIESPTLEVGAPAELTLVDPRKRWTLNATTNKSRSENSPYWESELVGQVIATFANGKHYVLQ